MSTEVIERPRALDAHADYARFLAEYGFTEPQVRAMVENTDDQIDLPSVYEKLVLRSSVIDGYGLFARHDLRVGEPIALARVNGKRTAAGRYTNHSPNQNAVFVALPNGDIQMIAAREIKNGEEVTVDYRQAGRINGQDVQPVVDLAEMRRKVEFLEAEMRQHPQLDPPLKHYFSQGIYARELTIPKGALLTGKIHKYEQLNILSKGDISVLTENGVVRKQAPFTIVSPPGTKRIAYAHEECVWTTIHGTDLKDLELIENYFIAQSDAEYLAFERAVALEYQGAAS